MIAVWLNKHRVSILFLFLILTIAGTFTTIKLPVSLFPNIVFPRVIVNVDAGDMPIDRMIVEVSRPLEYVLRKVPGVNSIRSISNSGTAELSINFSWGYDMWLALLHTQAALNGAIPNLPNGITINALRVDISGYPMFGLAITSVIKDLIALRDFANFELQPLLNSVDGVASVEMLGGQNAEFQIILNPVELKRYSLTLNDVDQALAAGNTTISVGRIEDRYRLYLIMSGLKKKNIEELKQTVIRSDINGILMLGDIAEVKAGAMPAWIKITSDNKNAVLMNVRQQIGANTVAIANDIKNKLAVFTKTAPPNIKIQTYYDQSKLIKASATSVKDAILIGAILAAIVVLLFLKNLRLTIIVVLIIPCVISTTVLTLYLFNMSFNIMTLGGIAAAVGLVIDDAVVMIEHIERRIVENYTNSNQQNSGILSSAMEMLKPLTGSSLATIVIFIPLSFLNGITGSLFKALALTMTSALIISFFFSLLVVPLLGEYLLKNMRPHKEKKEKLLAKMQHQYRALMQNVLLAPKLLLIPIIGFMLIGYAAYNKVESGFMPHMDEGTIAIDYTTKAGTSLTETDRILRQVEKIINATPEVSGYSRRTGLLFGGSITPPNRGDFFISLKDQPRRGIDQVMDELRSKIETSIPSLQFGIAQLIGDMIGDLTSVPQPIEIKIFGATQLELIPLAREVAEKISRIYGVVEIKNGIIYAGDNIDIIVDPIRASLFGLDPDSVNRQIKNQIAGNYASNILVKDKVIPIRILSQGNLYNRVEQINNLLIIGASGKYTTLDQIANVEIKTSQTQQVRENLKPMIAVTARITGRGLGSTMHDIKQVMGKLKLPHGVYIQYGGLYQEQQKAFSDLILVFFSAELLVIFLLLVIYENISIVFSILVMTLLTLPGMFLGLYLTNTELNISSMMGMTMVIGMVTEIAIFYFSELNTSTEQNKKNKLIHVGVMRMRPILMTSIIAVLALLPLAFGIGVGSEMQQPLAITIIAGLITAVPLILIVMPSIYFTLQKKVVSHPRSKATVV